MTKINAIGVTFTIAVLLCLLIFSHWRLIVASNRLVKCYQDQLRDAVTLFNQTGA